MSKIYYNCKNFKKPYLSINTTDEMSMICRKIDLYRAIITVGSPTFITWKAIKTNGFLRTISSSILRKILLVFENIESNPNGIYRHKLFDSSLSDEKRIISYNLGMAITKLYSEKLLNIPNLIHVEHLKKSGIISFNKTSKRGVREPDLIGEDNRNLWHIFEAKGMSNNEIRKKLKAAKIQVQSIKTINALPPETACACATHISKKRIYSEIEDPEPNNSISIKFERNQFYKAYYDQFFSIVKGEKMLLENKKYNGIEFKTFNIQAGDLSLEIGLDKKVFNILVEENYSAFSEYYSSRIETRANDLNQENMSFGIDGVLVKYINE